MVSRSSSSRVRAVALFPPCLGVVGRDAKESPHFSGVSFKTKRQATAPVFGGPTRKGNQQKQMGLSE